MGPLDPTDLLDLYWAGRATLVDQAREHPRLRRGLPEVLPRWRRSGQGDADPQGTSDGEAQAVLEVPDTEPSGDGHEEEATLGLMASDAEALRHKSFAACTPEELAAVRRIMARIRLTPPKRRTRRTRSAPSGRSPDLRRMVRESLRMHGEPAELFWRRRKIRLRPLILILDVSGSMADYSRNLLQFAYSAKRAAARVEVFCFGTRLTRVTRALDHRRPDDALELAARPCSTGRAGPGSVTRWTRSSGTGGGGACAGAGSW